MVNFQSIIEKRKGLGITSQKPHVKVAVLAQNVKSKMKTTKSQDKRILTKFFKYNYIFPITLFLK